MRAQSHELFGIATALTAIAAWHVGLPDPPDYTTAYTGSLLHHTFHLALPDYPLPIYAAIFAGALIGAELPDLDQPGSRITWLFPLGNGIRDLRGSRLLGSLVLTAIGIWCLGISLLAWNVPTADHTTTASRAPGWLATLPDPATMRLPLALAGAALVLFSLLGVSRVCGWITGGHRGLTHSVTFATIATLFFASSTANGIPGPPGLLPAFTIAYWTHLAADACTITGIPLILRNFGPWIWLLKSSRRIKTGETTTTPEEKRLLACLLALALLAALPPLLRLDPPPSSASAAVHSRAPAAAAPPWSSSTT